MDSTTFYAPILKSEKQDDGTLLVTGIATDSTLDVDEQVCDNDWLKTAMPQWFKWGNVREQHSHIAAGTATEYAEKDGAHHITVRVVDPSSIKKVENKVLKGFSIGIKRPRVVVDEKAAGGRIVDGEIVEVSLVDRPANPACKLSLAKAAEAGEQVAPGDLDKGLVKDETLIEKEAHGHHHMHSHESGFHAHSHAHDSADSFGDHGDGATHSHGHGKEHPPTVDGPMPGDDGDGDAPTGAPDDDASKAADTPVAPVTLLVKAALAEPVGKWDAASYKAAWQALSNLIAVEAKEMAAGADETYCISVLVSAAQSLKDYLSMEMAEGETDGSDLGLDPNAAPTAPRGEARVEAYAMGLDAEADLTKAFGSDAFKTSISEIVRESMEDVAKSVSDLTERLSRVEKQAVSGGPVRVVPQNKAVQAVDPRVAKARDYRTKAAATTDRLLQEGYLNLARQIEGELAR